MTTCATCQWGYKDELGDLICVNYYSNNCTEYVRAEENCEHWEEAGE